MADLSLKHYEQRATDENRAAARSTCPEVSLAHRQMPRRYAEKARKTRRASRAARYHEHPILGLRITNP